MLNSPATNRAAQDAGGGGSRVPEVAGTTRWRRRASGAVVLVVAGAGLSVVLWARSGVERDDIVAHVREAWAAGHPGSTWTSWCNGSVRRDWPWLETIPIGGTWRLDGRRAIATRYARGWLWCDEWTPGDSTFVVRVPAGEFVFVETGGTVLAAGDGDVPSEAALRNAWLLAGDSERVVVVDIARGRRIEIPRGVSDSTGRQSRVR